MKPILLRNFFALSLLLAHVSVFSQHFMYQPGSANGKLYMKEDHNLSVRTHISGGTSKKAYNSTGNKVGLLDLYGNQKGAYALHGVSLSPLTGNLLLVAQAAQIKDLTNKSSLYGNIQFKGKMNMFSGGMSVIRRVSDHCSMRISVPFHHFNIKDVSLVNLTPANEIDGDSIAIAQNLTSLLAAYNIHAGDVKDTTVGDIQVLSSVNFTRSEDTHLGEASFSISAGLTLPTARQKKLNEAFYIPMGNNGHVGFPILLNAHLSAHKYATFNTHFGAEFFLKHDSTFRMKTDLNQNGFIKLATGQAREKLGNKYDVNGGMCLHTESKEFGLGVEYRYERQGKTTLTPFDLLNFDTTIVNSDDMLQSWQRHNLVVKAFYAPEWEESKGDSTQPHFNFSYTQPLKGKRVLNTNMFGGSFGLDFSWNF